MNMYVRSKIVKIGNSRGVRIPRALLEQAGLKDQVEMRVEDNKLIIHSIREVRQDWEAHYSVMAANGDDRLIDQYIPTEWDEEEWEW